MVTFDFALETVLQLPQVERDDLIEILKKRQAQEWRKETADYYHGLKKEINDGDIKPVTAKMAITDLHRTISLSF